MSRLVCSKCGRTEWNLDRKGERCGAKLNHGLSTEKECDGELLGPFAETDPGVPGRDY